MGKKMRRQSGFILILTTFIIAASVFLISFVINRVNAYYKMSNFWVKSEKARMLAYSGIDIAISQLVDFDTKKLKEIEKKGDKGETPSGQGLRDIGKEADTGDEKKGKKSSSKKFLDFLFKKLNHWQKFTLSEKADEIDGEIEIYISCEEGKINLNKLIFAIQSQKVGQQDFDLSKDNDKGKDKDKPVSEGEKKIYEFINEKLKPIFAGQKKSLNLDSKKIDSLASRISKRYKDGLDDVTELLVLESKEFKQWKDDIFLSHDLYDKNYIALSDLFTVSTDSNKVTPLLFSRAIQILLGLKEIRPDLDKMAKDFINNLQEQKIDWGKIWSPVISSFYSKEYQNLPSEFKNSLFENKFEPNTFSVVSYGKVGLVTKKICAIIKRNKKEMEKDKPFIVQKVYWLD